MVWLTNWNYRKAITISNSGSTLTDYQVLTTIDTASLITALKMRSDCGDIRLTDNDGSTIINYWIESGCNTPSTKIWTKIPSIPGGTKTIYLYYGNSLATYNNSLGATNTFLFSDEFDYTDTPTNHGWIIYKGPYGKVYMSNGQVVLGSEGGGGYASDGNAMIVTQQSFSSSIIVEEKIDYGYWNWYPVHNMYIAGSGWIEYYNYSGPTTTGYNSGISWPASQGGGSNAVYSGGIGETTYSAVKTGDRPAWIRLAYDGNNTLKVWYSSDGINWQLKLNNITKNNYNNGNISLNMVSAGDRLNTIKVDYIRVRKYASPEPTSSIPGIEELSGAPICPSVLKYEGDIVHLQATPKDGIGPYTVIFKKNNISIASLSNVIENTDVTYDYTLTNDDIRYASLGTIDFSVYIEDSCPTGAQTCLQDCIITIGCIAPVCNFTVN